MTKPRAMVLMSERLRPVSWLVFIILISACTTDDESDRQPVADSPSTHTDSSERDPIVPSAMELEAAQAEPLTPIPSASDVAVTPDSEPHSITYNSYDLLGELQTLAWDEDAVSDEHTADLLRRLRLQGADALIPIRDFLLNGDNFDEVPSEFRQALLDVLLSLGLPEVEDVALQLLTSAPAASEVLQLGLYLESIQPGKYTDSILLASEQALIDADPAKVLPAEFFQLLGALGNEKTVSLLANMPAHHEAYASIALASIPDGSGLPPLERDARLFEAGRDTMQGRLALQLLAQMAPQFPRAAAVLTEVAKRGAIPHDVWPYVLDIVAGNWELTLLEPSSGDLVGSHTFYSPEGNQVIYRVARQQDEVDDGLHAQRLYLLDLLQALAPPDLRIEEGN